MNFSTTLIAVQDMDKSLAFYRQIFRQEVVCDLGWNKTLTCGLTLQLHFDRLVGFPLESMHFKSNNMELYFETEHMDDFMHLLEQHPEVERVHDLKTYPWRQRVIRIFDPDGHMIEIGEQMESVACREFEQGNSAEETAKIIEHPLELVQKWYCRYLEKKSSAGIPEET